MSQQKIISTLILSLSVGLLTTACGNNSETEKSNLIEARRNVENYKVSPVSFRSIDAFFDTESVAATPGAPLPQKPAPLDFTLELSGENKSFQEALVHTDTNAILVMHKGKIIYEQYLNGADANSRFISWSMAKSITSILFGIALNEGKIKSLDDKIETYLPELENTVYAGVTLKNMLLQRAGTSYTEFTLMGTADVDRLADQSIFRGAARFADISELEIERTSEPGESFNYSTLTSTLIGRVVEAATSMSLARYTEEKLWQPAGMQKSAYWMLDGKPGEGLAFAGGGFNATVRDYARIGQMMLNDGQINNQQIISKDWVRESTQYQNTEPVIAGTPRGYQYQWWTFLNTEIFEAVGIHGQFISVDPKTETVIVKNSYWPERGGGSYAKENHQLFTAIREEIIKRKK